MITFRKHKKSTRTIKIRHVLALQTTQFLSKFITCLKPNVILFQLYSVIVCYNFVSNFTTTDKSWFNVSGIILEMNFQI